MNEDNTVDNATVPAETTPLCPIFLAITNPATVAAEPSIIKTAISFSSLKPSFMAIGRKIAVKSISFMNVAPHISFKFLDKASKSNRAPIDRSPIGLASRPR